MNLNRRIPNVPKMEDRLISKASRPFHVHGKRNPAGSKLARKFVEHSGRAWKGEVISTALLTELNNERAVKRLGIF